MIDKREVGGIKVKKKYWLGGVLSAMVIVGGVAMVRPSLALFTSQDSEINEFETGNVDIEVEENFDDKCSDFSTACTKEVWIKNQSFQTDAVIRVALVPYWQLSNGSAWAGDVSSSVIELNFSNSKKWVDGGDGYYYYNEVVEAGQPTEQLLSSVKINIPSGLEERYDGKTLVVDVKAEAVQPTMAAVDEVWPNLPTTIRTMIDNMDGVQ